MNANDPTHLQGRILDVVITRSDLPPPPVQVDLPGEYSDYALLVFQLPVPRPPVCFTNISTRAWRNFDENKFLADLQASPLRSPSVLLSELSVDELQELYDSALVALVDRDAPRRTTRRRHQPTMPWFDSQCAAAKRKVRMYERQYRRTNSLNDRNIWCNQTRPKQQLYERKQSEYWDNKISNCHGDPKKLWRSLSSELRKEKPKLPDSEELSAERFSEAFQAKLDRVRSATAAAPPLTFEGPCCISNLEDFKLLDDAAVRRFISSAACKFCDFDPAPTWIIKKYANELSPFIAKLFSTSLTSDLFPTSQKCANCWIRVGKSTPPRDSISISEAAILKELSDVYEAADSGKLTLLGLLDISAAFDTVDHQILLGRLRHSFGISGTVLDWIASYLTGRTQFVRFNGQSSKTIPVTSGAPQGSVLGPILFLTYTAEVARKHGFNVHAYADDLQIYDHTAPLGMAGLLQRMVVCIEDVSTWMSSNRLCLHPSKTELIWLGSSRRLQNWATDTEMSVLGSLIHPVDSVRDLGVLFDSGPTLSDHVNSRRVVLLPYSTTSHRAMNIDGWGCQGRHLRGAGGLSPPPPPPEEKEKKKKRKKKKKKEKKKEKKERKKERRELSKTSNYYI